MSECLRASEGRLPASLLGDHGLLGDVVLGLGAEFMPFSSVASPSRGRSWALRLGVEQLLAVKCVASEMELPCGTSSELLSGG